MDSPSQMTNAENEYPTLRTRRLVLRAFRRSDAAVVTRLAGARAIADTTISIPHPYAEVEALNWIGRHEADWRQGRAVRFAVEFEPSGLVGGIELRELNTAHAWAEMGFWVGEPYWGKGFAREAAGAVVRYGFEALLLNRICAHYMVRNPASGRVLESVGFRKEGLLRQAVRKWGRFEDVVICGILRKDIPDD